MKWKALVIVVYLVLPFCSSLVKRIRPQEYLAIQSSCEKWFIIFINSWCWNTWLIDDFVFRLRSLLYSLEGVANVGVIDGVADANFYYLFGYGATQFIQLIDPPCSNVALLRNTNSRNLLLNFDPEKITRELVSLVEVYERVGCKFQGDLKFAFEPSTNQKSPGCQMSVYGLSNGVPSYLEDYRSRYRPCSSLPWNTVDFYDVMTSCKFWIVASVAQDSDWPCVREIEKFAVYAKDKFEFATIKGSTFGVWLFLENKLMPVSAMSDSTTCDVSALFDVVQTQMNKELPPLNQICDKYASSPHDVEVITILNRNKLLESWDNWIVLQTSPFDVNYPIVYNEFKQLFEQLKGSVKFGFLPNPQFGLWVFGRNKIWPQSITSDPVDLQTQRYMTALLDVLNEHQSTAGTSSFVSPYIGNLDASLQNLEALQQQVPYYQNTGSWSLGVTPRADLIGFKGFQLNNNDNSNFQYRPNVEITSESSTDCKNCTKLSNRGKGNGKVYYGSRGLDLEDTTPPEEASEEFILEPIVNLTSIPDKWKAALNELFADSKDFIVKISFPSLMSKKLESSTLATGIVGDTTSPSTTVESTESLSNYGTENAIKATEDASTSPTSLGKRGVTHSSGAKEITDDGMVTASTLNMVVTESAVAQNVANTKDESANLKGETVTIMEREAEKSDAAEKFTKTAGTTVSLVTSSQSSQAESSVPSAERSADLGVTTEGMAVTTGTEGMANTTSTEGMANTTSTEGMAVTTSTEGMAVTTSTEGTANTTSTDVAETSKLPSTTEARVEFPSTTESVTPEVLAETSKTTVTTTEAITPEESSRDFTQIESTTPPISESFVVNTTTNHRTIETTDVETVRKDCKFWVLISSTDDAASDDKYERCYEKLTSIMMNYKNVYKFGAVHAGEFFINLYLKNKSNPISISTDYSCDENKIKATLDAHKSETPGEFCQDQEDVSEYD